MLPLVLAASFQTSVKMSASPGVGSVCAKEESQHCCADSSLVMVSVEVIDAGRWNIMQIILICHSWMPPAARHFSPLHHAHRAHVL